ncbi:MAG: radical SAM family heme chaperone HemW [Planctomycetota bacterium]
MAHPLQAISTADADPRSTAGPPRFTPETHARALYLHLPFCFHKCHYCDFYSVVERGDTDRQDAFTDALIAELTDWSRRITLRPTTVFAGGGTPTYLRPELWDRLLTALHGLNLLDHAAEFTVEANPETVTPALMKQLADGGVNRVSIGAQSFQRESLKALERWHDPDNVGRAVDACRAAGLHNLSLDLIFAVPGQTLAMLEDDLARLAELRPTHLSTYGLTYEPNTALSARLRLGQVTPLDEDTQRAMYQCVLDRLQAHGFEHYEISNWARQPPPGPTRTASDPADLPRPHAAPPLPADLRCRHNLAYWRNQNWLGVGPAAASHLGGHRWRNAPNLNTYLKTSPTPTAEDYEHLPPDQRVGEQLMLGLRLAEGVALDWLRRHLPADDRRHDAIDEMIDLNLLERTPARLRLTRAGLFVADSVIAKLL